MEMKSSDNNGVGFRANVGSSNTGSEGSWWRWSHGMSGSIASSSDGVNHIHESSTSSSSGHASSPSESLRWHKRTSRGGLVPKEKDERAVFGGVLSISSSSSASASSSTISPSGSASNMSPVLFSSSKLGAMRNAAASKKKASTSSSRSGRELVPRKKISSASALKSTSSSTSYFTGSAHGIRENKGSALGGDKVLYSDITWTAGPSSRKVTRKDKKLYKTFTTADRTLAPTSRSAQYISDQGRDRELDSPSLYHGSKPSRATSSSRTTSRFERRTETTTLSSTMFDSAASSNATSPSTVSATSSFGSPSYSTTDPLVDCARAVLQDCIRKRHLGQRIVRKRTIDERNKSDYFDSIASGYKGYLSKSTEHGLVSSGSSSSDDELSQLSSMEASFNCRDKLDRGSDGTLSREELYRELMLFDNHLGSSPEYDCTSPFFEEKGLPVEIRYQLPLALGTANETDKECTICQIRYGIGDHIVTLPCQHFFHACCVDKWLWNHTSCPLCRTEVSLDVYTDGSRTKHNFTECSLVDQEVIRRRLRSSQRAGFRPVVSVDAELEELESNIASMSVQNESTEAQHKYLVWKEVKEGGERFEVSGMDLHCNDYDEESNMTYFLPNGIADDSPPKTSFMTSSSFGPIGGEVRSQHGHSSVPSSSSSSTSSASVSASTSSYHPHHGEAPTAASHPREFGNLLRPFTHTPATSDSLGAIGTPSSSRQNFLLSDLGGEIHELPRSLDFTNNRDERFFQFSGLFDGGLSGDGDQLRRTHGRSFDGENHSPAPSLGAASGSIGMDLRSTTSIHASSRIQTSPSFLSGVQDLSYNSNSQNWPMGTIKSRRVLHSPPGLSPPGIGKSTISTSRLGTPGDSPPHQQHHASTDFGMFSSTASAPNESVFPTESRFVSNLRSNLPSLNLTLDAFATSHGQPSNIIQVPNPDLAELNSLSMKVDDIDRLDDTVRESWKADKSPVSDESEKKSKVRKSSHQPRHRSSEKMKSNIRAESRGSPSDANSQTECYRSPRSPVSLSPGGPQNVFSSPSTTKDFSPTVDAAQHSAATTVPDHTSSKGRKRNQLSTDTKNASRSMQVEHRGGNRTVGKKKNYDDSERMNESVVGVSGSDSGDSPQKVSPNAGKMRGWDASGESKSAVRGTSGKKNSVRGSEKGTGAVRRQVYREKIPKGTAKEVDRGNYESSTSENLEIHLVSQRRSEILSDENNTDLTNRPKKKDTSFENKPSHIAENENIVPEPKVSGEKTEALTTKKTAKASQPRQKEVDQEFDERDKIVSKKSIARKSAAPKEVHSGRLAKMETAPPVKTTNKEDDTHAELSTDGEDSEKSVDILAPVTVSDNCVPLSDGQKKNESPSGEPSLRKQKGDPPSNDFSRKEVPNAPVETTTKVPTFDKKSIAGKDKDQRKEKAKKEKSEKRKTSKLKKDRRDASASIKPDALDVSGVIDDTKTSINSQNGGKLGQLSEVITECGLVARSMVRTLLRSVHKGWTWTVEHVNVRRFLWTAFSYVESVLAVVFSVLLLLSLHGASWFIRIHRVAFRAVLMHRHIGFCFIFLYAFPFLVQHVFPWAPPWAPVCLWYAFLVQLFCTNGSTAMVTTFRILLPLVFLVEGVSHHSFLLDFNGAELLLTSFIISAVKTSNLCSPMFFLSLAAQCLSAVFLGSDLMVQWVQLALALYSLHSLAATEEDWNNMAEDDEDVSCQNMPMHHSIADYNYPPVPSAASIQKTKRLDRRALAYVRGRKLR